MYKVLTKIRSGVEIIHPGTILERLPADWHEDYLLRKGAILRMSEESGADPEGTVAETVKAEAAVTERKAAPVEKAAPGKKKPAAKKPAGKSKTKTAPKPVPKGADIDLPEGIDPSLVGGTAEE